MLNQPFSAFLERSEILKGVDYLKSIGNHISEINKRMAIVAGGDLEQQVLPQPLGTAWYVELQRHGSHALSAIRRQPSRLLSDAGGLSDPSGYGGHKMSPS